MKATRQAPVPHNGRQAKAACEVTSALALALALASCGGSDGPQRNVAPDGLRVVKTTTHGTDNDLLTGGVGVPALADAASTLPTYADAANPTAGELRRAAIARKFDKGAGEGVLWGTGFDPATQAPVVGNGKITGQEILAERVLPLSLNILDVPPPQWPRASAMNCRTGRPSIALNRCQLGGMKRPKNVAMAWCTSGDSACGMS